jgi:tol-pal system protein YbgF
MITVFSMLRRIPILVLLGLGAGIGAPALAQDAADAIVRLGRLENQVRQLSGFIEQLQFENRQLKEQLRKFQEDVDYRFQEGRGGSARQAAPSATPSQSPNGATPARPPQQPAGPARRSDAFDPSQAPGAPGVPRPLGTAPPSGGNASAAPGAGAPMPLPGAALSGIGKLIDDEEAPPPGAAPLDLGQAGRSAAAPVVPRAGPSVAATGTGDPRSDYEVAYAFLGQQQYEQAEMGFRRFIQSHPRDRLVPEAMYWLGETYLQRNRAREAAEQFLNVSTEHPNAGKAPDALLKLGVALNSLGARDRACAVFAELDRKYPQAGTAVKQGSEREQKRAKCL